MYPLEILIRILEENRLPTEYPDTRIINMYLKAYNQLVSQDKVSNKISNISGFPNTSVLRKVSQLTDITKLKESPLDMYRKELLNISSEKAKHFLETNATTGETLLPHLDELIQREQVQKLLSETEIDYTQMNISAQFEGEEKDGMYVLLEVEGLDMFADQFCKWQVRGKYSKKRFSPTHIKKEKNEALSLSPKMVNVLSSLRVRRPEIQFFDLQKRLPHFEIYEVNYSAIGPFLYNGCNIDYPFFDSLFDPNESYENKVILDLPNISINTKGEKKKQELSTYDKSYRLEVQT